MISSIYLLFCAQLRKSRTDVICGADAAGRIIDPGAGPSVSLRASEAQKSGKTNFSFRQAKRIVSHGMS
jgi:hypothetical protein